ncbi:Teneurin-1 and related extracellular matrix proteins, contain EGF-like repeats [Plasmopara halstedii]|uniref:Teneurin-1 and related extracellular matrix proteins, contain EGF-like repeats n=1 Tax=Plasmopara halstedii TaxID=4781 RepID=A0A0P1AZ16_PLAHL|nr:Teneurin-1 and related extracellular matrix proteins, contain EGF-like repeats [Plasmopara halstedii]CEG47122.1 Teneurin-1 and related extracellular matrix proteins, contain EGF-like repeats [Plasmopara halstedii]|eukprot:XP_024583491.1 Teneurin-1 and related extracellular matrix proteins, contain EGF-like repeats [Plasmopara halstedii]
MKSIYHLANGNMVGGTARPPKFIFIFTICQLVCAQLGVPTGNLCASLNNCNAHGRCDTVTKTCTCYEGFGAPTDITTYRSPDCSLRTCPAGPSWGGIPTSTTKSHTKTECSDGGVCDRSTGMCRCYSGYEGSACQRSSCPNGCSGHGQCLSMRELAAEVSAFPLSPSTKYEGDVAATTWDQDRIHGCLCDSGWPVGLGAGESQLSQYFGPDCSRMHCPSGDDPMTAVDETDCEGVVAQVASAHAFQDSTAPIAPTYHRSRRRWLNEVLLSRPVKN